MGELSAQLGRQTRDRVGLRFPAQPARAILGLQVQRGEGGAQVVAVSPGGPAAAAGIKEGDVIVAIGGVTLAGTDPGRALISGKCNDVGTIVMQQFRGMAARAPYFSNGSASNLRELVDFYDRRYNIQYSEREKVDLENFLATL